MHDHSRPATGPIILEHLTVLAEDVKVIRETQDRRGRQLANLSQQVDRFLAAELDITGTLGQVREVVAELRREIGALRDQVEALDRTVHGTLALAVGDPGLDTRGV